MTSRSILLALPCLVFGIANTLAATDGAAIAEVEPPTSWVDPDTGHRVLRLTRELNSASLYFNQNAYTPDGRHMVYMTPDGISMIDLASFKTRTLVTGRVSDIIVGRKTSTVYYTLVSRNDRQRKAAFCSTNVETGELRKIFDLPPRSIVADLNADESLAVGIQIEDHPDAGAAERTDAGAAAGAYPLEAAPNKGPMMEKRLDIRLPMTLFALDLRTGTQSVILRGTDWLSHLRFSPTDRDLLMYCHEGPWHKVDRIWTIRVDGTRKTLVHKRSMEGEIAGHEFWSPDGSTIWYDLQTPRSEVFWLAGFNVNTGQRTWFSLQRNEWSIHFNASSDHRLFCGDGGDPSQVARAADGQWIYLFQPEPSDSMIEQGDNIAKKGSLRAKRLVNMSKHNYKLEPNVRFSPDQKYVIFRSNMFGPTYVFAVEVAPTEKRQADMN